jgi:hypothetical protein
MQLDISKLDAKAPPPQTAAFWAIVDAGGAPEDAELSDVLDSLGKPEAVTLSDVTSAALGDFHEYLADRKNRRVIPHRMEACGYVAVRNNDAKDGRWKVNGKSVMIYARAGLSVQERQAAARRRADRDEDNILRPEFGRKRRHAFRGP